MQIYMVLDKVIVEHNLVCFSQANLPIDNIHLKRCLIFDLQYLLSHCRIVSWSLAVSVKEHEFEFKYTRPFRNSNCKQSTILSKIKHCKASL